MTVPQAVLDLVAPLRQELEKADAQIRQIEADLKAAKESRQAIARMLNYADPQPNGKQSPGRRRTTVIGDRRLSEERLDEVHAWLLAHRDGDAFSTPDLRDDPAFKGVVTPSRIGDALKYLADRGVLRLDHVGGHRGRQKFYKLVRDAQ